MPLTVPQLRSMADVPSENQGKLPWNKSHKQNFTDINIKPWVFDFLKISYRSLR